MSDDVRASWNKQLEALLGGTIITIELRAINDLRVTCSDGKVAIFSAGIFHGIPTVELIRVTTLEELEND